jgi:hypothetical protein
VKNADKILVQKSEGKKPLGRSRCGWEDDNRFDLREIGREGVGWAEFFWLRISTSGGFLVNTAVNLRFP